MYTEWWSWRENYARKRAIYGLEFVEIHDTVTIMQVVENAAHRPWHSRGGKHMCFCYFKCSGVVNLPQGKLKTEELAKDKTKAEKMPHFEDPLPPHMIQAKVFVTIQLCITIKYQYVKPLPTSNAKFSAEHICYFAFRGDISLLQFTYTKIRLSHLYYFSKMFKLSILSFAPILS